MKKSSQELRWLKERKSGIGASEAAAILGMSQYKTNIRLWEEKTGRREPDELADNPFVTYGKAAEGPIRQLFMLDHPEYSLAYHQYKIIRNKDHPFILATLDGELTETATGRLGVLEIKTTEIMNAQQWTQWKDRIPQAYYIQILHQMLATGWGFVELNAQIKYTRKDGMAVKLTETYHIERADHEADMEDLLRAELDFWNHVTSDTTPGLMLPGI